MISILLEQEKQKQKQKKRRLTAKQKLRLVQFGLPGALAGAVGTRWAYDQITK